MTASLVQSAYTYKSTSGGRDYYWEVVVDAQGLVEVRNVRAPTGLIRDPVTGVPQTVAWDIDESIRIVQALTLETAVFSGTLTFTGQSSQTATITPGLLNNTSYRVAYTPPDNVLIRTLNKTITSFDADVGVCYGSPTDPKDVDFVVLVKTAQASTFSGTVTFTDASGGREDVAFGTSFPTTAYRVILTPDDFVLARVVDKTSMGFGIELGITLLVGQTLDVGYDVFL